MTLKPLAASVLLMQSGAILVSDNYKMACAMQTRDDSVLSGGMALAGIATVQC